MLNGHTLNLILHSLERASTPWHYCCSSGLPWLGCLPFVLSSRFPFFTFVTWKLSKTC